MKPANHGRDEWTHWQDEDNAEVEEGGETRQATWSRVSETAADSSHQSWMSTKQHAAWGPYSHNWGAPTPKELAAPECATDHEWR